MIFGGCGGNKGNNRYQIGNEIFVLTHLTAPSPDLGRSSRWKIIIKEWLLSFG
jgi:hypothetical protein